MVGLALSGGAIRGVAHIGVIKALEEARIPIHCISGTSAGSLVGGIYACGVPVHILEAEALALNDKLLDFNASGAAKAVLSLFGGRRVGFKGLIKGDGVQKLAWRLTGGKNIRDAQLGLALCAVDLLSGQTIFFTNARLKPRRGDYIVDNDVSIADAVAASSTIPAVFVPRPCKDWLLVDGGVTEYVPVKVLRDMGAKFVIAVDLGKEAGVPKAPDDFLEISSRSLDIMGRRLADFSGQKADAIIAPFVSDVDLFDFKRTPELLERGYEAAKKMIPSIRSAMGCISSRR